jgi:PAS domain S-box-containing protein
MPKKNAIQNSKLNMPDDIQAKSVSFLKRPLILGLLVFLILLLLFTILIYQRYQLAKKAEKEETHKIVTHVQKNIEETLTHSLLATKTLSFFIDKGGEVTDFDSIAAQILESGTDIDALQMLPGGTVKYVHPVKGNEMLLGYDILRDPAQNKEACKAIEKKEMFFTSPLGLKTGNSDIVGMLPVFKKGKFWGFSSVVIKMSTLFKTPGLDSTGKHGYYFQLLKVNPETKKEEYFLPGVKGADYSYSVPLMVPNVEWRLAATIPTSRNNRDIILFILAGFLLSVLGAVFVYRFSLQPKRLSEMVLNRTSQLRNTENKYRALVERVSDAFVALDKNWVYTYVNEKAGELLSKSPQTLIGKNIWKEFPEGADQPFQHAFYRAMNSQEYQFSEEFYAVLNKWIESHIYPSKEGLTIFFKDVTAMKEITQALRNNEEKYRSLIEQASDGIVITNLDGEILEINNSIKRMTGFEEEDMIGYHLKDFLPETDIDAIPLRIKELMAGRNLIYERRLLNKDGTILDVEINAKMASSHTFIGFIRDITGRKKYENTLAYQARIIGSVSDAITSLDMNRAIVSWNKACEELYGFTQEEVIGKRIPEMVTFEYRDITNEEVFKKVYTEGYWRGEFNFIHPKTKTRVHLSSAINILKDKHGEINGFIITSRDITEKEKAEAALKKSNERFELIVNATNDAIWDHDYEKNETWINNKFYELYGVEPGSQEINFDMFLERIHPDEIEGIKERVRKTFENGDVSSTEIFRFKTEKGEYRTFYNRSYIKYNDSGRAIRILGALQDITERELAQKKILESEEKYRTLIEQASEGIFIADTEGRFAVVNKAGCNIAGYTEEELWHMTIYDLVLPEDLAKQPFNFSDLLKGKVATAERRLKRKDGTLIDVEVTAKFVSGERFLTFVRDISERKIAEETLKKSNERLELIANAANDAIWDYDFEKNEMWGNTRLYEIHGLEPDHDKIDFKTFLEHVHADERTGVEERMKSAIENRVLLLSEVFRFKTKKGVYRTFFDRAFLKYNDLGKPMRMFGTLQDITEREEARKAILASEEKYRTIIEQAVDGIFIADENTYLVDVNSAGCLMCGYTRAELKKIKFQDVIPPEDLINNPLRITKMDRGQSVTNERRLICKDGTIIVVEISAKKLLDGGYQLFVRDIAERKKAEHLLQKSYDDIRQLVSNLQSIREDERTSIAREIHDELGQQLTGLKMDIHWLSRKINTADNEVADKIKESIELINATIASVRKIATDLRPSILDDLGLMAALEWQGEEFEKRSGISVKFNNTAGDLLLKPEATTTIFRIYQELLTNVARHANASLVTVNLDKHDDRLFFNLKDDGAGFNLETIGQKKTLGLLGIKERTALLGGTYEFKSNAGLGSETIISIPIL